MKVDAHGFVEVDRVSRTSATGVYAAGDCTGVLMLASVAAMQGRIAMWHTLGEAVGPLRLGHVAATIFTDPEIATVGVSQRAVTAGEVAARVLKQPLATNPRAKMAGVSDGFVKLFTSPGTGVVLGGVVVAPRASELILAVSIAVEQRLTVEQLAQHVRRLPVPVRQPDRGRQQTDGVHRRHPLKTNLRNGRYLVPPPPPCRTSPRPPPD